MLVALFCCGCTAIFGAKSDTQAVDAAPLDAPGSRTEARISIAAPTCGDNIYQVSGEGSNGAGGTTITDYQWTITQGANPLATFSGSGDIPLATSTHVLGGTVDSFSLNPTLFTAPELLRVAIAGTAMTNQVFWSGFAIQDSTQYEVSLVVLSDIPGALDLRLIEHEVPNGNLGINMSISTTTAATRHVLPFESTASSGNARLMLNFTITAGYLIDNVKLRRVGQQDFLVSESFSADLAPWQASFQASGNVASIIPLPPAILDFPETILQLVVVDSSGTVSEVATQTIESPTCP